jgi:K319L-like, PKD domain
MPCEQERSTRWAFRLWIILIWSGVHVFPCLGVEATVWALTFKAPTEGVVLQSGQRVPVAMAVGKDINLRTLHFYWYRLDEEPLASRRAIAAPFKSTEAGSLLTGTVLVPAEALGAMRLLAVGEVARGRLESYEEFDEVLVTVETAASLTAIEFAVVKPWRFDRIGKRTVVPAVGQFDDGTVRSLTGPNVGSRFRSSDERVVSVDPIGGLQVKGTGKAQVIVDYRGSSGALEVIVEADDEVNRAPIAEVVNKLNVRSGELVVLDGLRSRDPDGDPLRYEWKQIRGNRVGLTNANESKATFVAPQVSERKPYQFSLTVTDMAGPDTMKGADSVPAVITVWVSP